MTDKNGRESAPREYDFFDDFEDVGGIFEDRVNPAGAFGDKDAIEDLRAEGGCVPMQGAMAADGMAAPVPHFDGTAILNSPSRVSLTEMVCLAGPCAHYTGIVQQDGQQLRTIRRCDRVCTWAEQLKLDDVDILGCSRHEPREPGPLPRHVEERIQQGHHLVRVYNEKAMGITGYTLGVCHEASCQHYAVMVVRESGGGTVTVERWCLKMGGAARPFKLDPNFPVLGCLSVEPGEPRDALDRSREYLAQADARHAARQGADLNSNSDDADEGEDDDV